MDRLKRLLNAIEYAESHVGVYPLDQSKDVSFSSNEVLEISGLKAGGAPDYDCFISLKGEPYLGRILMIDGENGNIYRIGLSQGMLIDHRGEADGIGVRLSREGRLTFLLKKEDLELLEQSSPKEEEQTLQQTLLVGVN